MRIAAIVEGYGEVEAVPNLLQRFLKKRQVYNVKVDPVLRAHKGSLVADTDPAKQYGIQYYIGVAREKNPDAIFILLDADDTCIQRQRRGEPKLGPWLQKRAQQVCHDTLIRVVVANREYEAWFLNAWHLRHPPGQFEPILNVEERSGGKQAVASLLGLSGSKSYDPRIHQPLLTRWLPFDPALGKSSRSYRRLLKVLDEIACTVTR